jgi:hypothetical protein
MATIIKDFAELGKIFHIKPKDKKNNNKKGNGKASGKKKQQSAERKCNKCGAVLRHIPDTNVWVCDGKRKVTDPDTKEQVLVDCNHKVLSRRVS